MVFVTGLFLGAIGGFFAGVFCAIASEADSKSHKAESEDDNEEL